MPEQRPDSAFAVVTKKDGKKERRYPVGDEKQQRSSLTQSHRGTPAEHNAVHRAVGARNKELLEQHKREEHGGKALKKALDGVLARFRKGGVVDSYPGSYPHAKWTVVNTATKASMGSYDDREAAVQCVIREMEKDPAALDNLRLVQTFNARDLVNEALASRTYR
jgi:hypothetical protein